MKIKMCINNLDLYAKKGDVTLLRNLTGGHRLESGDYELTEYHCMGLCFFCQSGPTAFVNDQLIHLPDK